VIPVPFLLTIIVALCFSLVLVTGSWAGISGYMELTHLPWDFKFFIIGLGMAYYALAWMGEHFMFQPLARWIGRMKVSLLKKTKTRKQYKVIQEQMLF
jgi:cation-transporting ATPase 13A3/4/5